MMSRLEKVKAYINEVPDTGKPYHNKTHWFEVYKAALKIAEHESLPEKVKDVLGAAALFHDIKPDEREAADYANKVLSNLGYTPQEIEVIKNLILATMGWKDPKYKPKSLLEKIICDADLANLGSSWDEFWDANIRLQHEFGIDKNNRSQYVSWLKSTYALLNNSYFTEGAKILFGNREKNAAKLKEIIDKIEEDGNNI